MSWYLRGKKVRILKFIEYYDEIHDIKKTLHVSHVIIGVLEEDGICEKVPTLFSNCQNVILLGNDKLVSGATKRLPSNIKNSFENKYIVIHLRYSYHSDSECYYYVDISYERYKFTKTPYKIFIPKEVIIIDLIDLFDKKNVLLIKDKKIKPCKKNLYFCNCPLKFPFLENLEKDDNPYDEQFLEWHWK